MSTETPTLRSPRGSLYGGTNGAPFATEADADAQYLPWKIAFRVQFQAEKFGLRFHPAQFPDTGNGLYTIRVLELNKTPNGIGPAQQYNASLKPGQEHLALRPGLYLTHINDTHLLSMPCEHVISSLQSAQRPTTLRFVDVEAGVVTPHELRDSLKIDPEPAASGSGSTMSRKTSAVGAPELVTAPVQSPSYTSASAYKIILLGTTGVGKSSVLAVSVSGDAAYMERRATTLEAEFGSFEIPDPDISNPNKIKARIWDTAGQERYRAITRSHYRRADGALLVYDVAEPDSFVKLGEWLKTLKETAGESLKSIMVLENKIDQLPEPQHQASGSSGGARQQRPSRFVQESEVQAFCAEQGLLFARTTAKSNATAFKWEGQRIADAVSTLLLHIHASNLARGMSSTGNNTKPGAAVDVASGGTTTGGTIELTDPPAGATGDSRSLSDCGSCGRSQ